MNKHIGPASVAGIFLSLASITSYAEPSGVTVQAGQESGVRPGMSQDQVRSTLGRPANDARYRNEAGSTWSYQVIGKQWTLFEVDFDAQGQVTSTSERVAPRDAGGNNGR